MTKTKRVKYNFLLGVPTVTPWSMKDLMAANPGVSYITLYMRLKKALKEKTVKRDGVRLDPTKRGCPLKLYRFTKVPKAITPTVLPTLATVEATK